MNSTPGGPPKATFADGELIGGWINAIAADLTLSGLQLRAKRLLIAAKNSQWKRTFTAELERAEILIPLPVRRFRFGSLPVIQLFEIVGADRAFPDSLDQVRQYGRG